jgi:hypothetical protein
MNFYRTTAMAPNASFDGRARHGVEAMKTFPAGTKFYVIESDPFDCGTVETWSMICPRTSHVIPRKVVEGIRPFVEAFEPEPIDEAIAESINEIDAWEFVMAHPEIAKAMIAYVKEIR